jgi:DNA-binding GntR family transcriptional regulator
MREVIASGNIAEVLGIKQGEKIYEIVRVRTGNGLPVVIFKHYVNMANITTTRKDIDENESIYELFMKKQKMLNITKGVFEAGY